MDQFTIGRIRIRRIEEWSGPFLPAAALFAGFDAAAYEATAPALTPEFIDPAIGRLRACIQSWVIEAPGCTLILDTGCGNDRERPGISVFDHLQTDFLGALGRAGYSPEDIDLVVCTHLHVDHTGWNTHAEGGAWRPTFQNARYIFPAADVEYWDPLNRDRFPDMVGAAVNAGFFEDSVRPILDAGLADLVEGGVELGEGLRLDPNPGHTPGCQTLTVSDGGESAMFVGDVLHHPLQILNPAWNSIFCEDAEAARAARSAVLARAADTGAILVSAHFAGEHAVRVRRSGEGFAPASLCQ